MLWKPRTELALAFLFVCAPCAAVAQTVPAASATVAPGMQPLSVGAGFSRFSPDIDSGHLLGGTLWIDYLPSRVPQLLKGLGVEAEARDLNYGRTLPQQWNLRQDTAEAGLIYSWPRYLSFRPYGKFLMGFGNTDYGDFATQARAHDSRTITCMGGGVEFRAIRSVWVRADYEYQIWPDFFKETHPAGKLKPKGFTVGAMFQLGGLHRH